MKNEQNVMFKLLLATEDFQPNLPYSHAAASEIKLKSDYLDLASSKDRRQTQSLGAAENNLDTTSQQLSARPHFYDISRGFVRR